MVDDIRDAVRQVLPGVRADLEALVRIPSVSADPGRHGEVRRSAEATARLFGEAGFPDVQILSAGSGQPAVVARRPAPDGAPTVLLYAHHDVQPEGAHADWATDPFEPTEHDGRLYGRGAADDKAGIAVHLAAIRAHETVAGRDGPPVGVTVFVEGEEEIGSPSLAEFLEAYRDRLAADVIVIADAVNWQVGTPALTTSLRGLVNCVVEVRALEHAVHSGMYGGPIPDALTALTRLLATLHDEDGNVAVEGLSSGRAADLELSEKRLRSESSMLDGVRLIGSGSLVDRLWARPAIAVLAVDAPRVAEASNTLIPSARAKISLRVAPGDDAEAAYAAMIRHLEGHAPWGVQVRVSDPEIGEPYAVRADTAPYDAARSAFREAWDGTDPVDMGTGGSIPFIAAFAEACPEAAILITGVEDPDTRAHGANEGLHLAEFERACLAEALLLDKLAE
ncbi:MAG: M20/M25/M40 family metallo-hydrolase [Propionibacteriales bacterium]|nr:M20/M25/M40 family metallo-hydrolase [Propionibacteriales bacterium]